MRLNDRAAGPLSPYTVLGLPLLYASGYFLPALAPTGLYLLPNRDFGPLIVGPSVVAIAIGAVLAYLIVAVIRPRCPPWIAVAGGVLSLAVMVLIALKGLFYSAGYDWNRFVPHGSDLAASTHWFKVAVYLAVVTIVWLLRARLSGLSRILGSLGFAFAVLAGVRLALLDAGAPAQVVGSPAAGRAAAAAAAATSRTRRVVWVIFDETDFDRLYSVADPAQLNLASFSRLARQAVFATNANSPASLTLYSIPALLTGVPVSDGHIRIDRAATLWQKSPQGTLLEFGQASSVFGALAADGLRSSVLGFYHPYCRLFSLARCDSAVFPEVGGWDAALWANVPDALLARVRTVSYWDGITARSVRLIPDYVERDDALTFIHLNVPHLPAAYADAALHVPPSADPLVEYSHNLVLADRLLGGIMQGLERQSKSRDLLLIVSSDHWLRTTEYKADAPEASRRIPLAFWRVGETEGIRLPERVSAVHTRDMILDFLRGRIGSQSEIAQWWVGKPVFPSYIVPGS